MIARFVFLSVLLLSVFVQAIDVFVIKNIKIYANNKNASIARNEAIEAGQLKAFRGLIKLHYPDALNKVNTIDKEDIYSLVESYDLSEEKRSSTNYYAKMNVRFSVDHVNKLMQGMGFQFYGAVSKVNSDAIKEFPTAESQGISTQEVVEDLNLTTLVVPIFIKNGREYWFDDGNSWLETWQKHKQIEKFVLPLVDLEDLSIINNKILNKNLIDLAPIFEKYSVNNIALYTFEDIENGTNHHVNLKVKYLNKYHYSWRSHYFQDEAGNDLDVLLDKAFDATQSFKFNSNLDTCCNIVNDLLDPKKMVIIYKINGISDWIQLEQIMKSIKYISDVNVEQVTADYYTFSIMCSISQENLAGIFAKYNLNLEEKNNKLMLVAKGVEE